MNRPLFWLSSSLVAVVLVVSPGCDDGSTAESKKATATSVESLTPKQKTAVEKAKKADPRSR